MACLDCLLLPHHSRCFGVGRWRRQPSRLAPCGANCPALGRGNSGVPPCSIHRLGHFAVIPFLAAADVRHLARALTVFYKENQAHLLEAYSTTCVRRVWRAEHFSWWMTSMLHRFPGEDSFYQRLQRAQLEYTVRSRAAATSLAENYVGLPFD